MRRERLTTTPNRDMMKRWHYFENRAQSFRLEPNFSETSVKCHACTRKKCASVRTSKCAVYTLRRVHGSCYCLDAKLPEEQKTNLRNAQDYEWNPDSGELDNNWDLFALTSPYKSPCTSLYVTLALSGLSPIPPFVVLPPLRVPFLPLMVPKMKSSTTWGFLSMLRMKMTRHTSSSGNSTILNVVGLLDPMCLFALSASICWWLEIGSLTQWSCLFIGIYSSHEQRIFTTISLFARCFITDVNLEM